jgi:hypothetical protein
MEVSRTSMKVAKVTVMATAQGLCFGFHWGSEYARAAIDRSPEIISGD